MKLNPVQKHQTNSSSLQGSNASRVSREKVSFGSAKEAAVKAMSYVEKKGFFVEFLIVDAISMIIPRIAIGLNRDRKDTGKINYKAGAEEAGRELISGPSMFLIPIGIMEAVKKWVAPAAHLDKATIKGFTDNMSEVIKNTDSSELLKKPEYLKEQLANKFFDKAFGKFEVDNLSEYKDKFVKMLTTEPSKDKKANKTMLSDFQNLVIELKNKNKSAIPDNASLVEISKEKGNKFIINAGELFEDFRSYSKDVMAKFVKNDFAKGAVENAKENAVKAIEKFGKSRGNIRFATAMTSFLAVGGFLLYLPKLYQMSSISPAERSAKLAVGEQVKEGDANENK